MNDDTQPTGDAAENAGTPAAEQEPAAKPARRSRSRRATAPTTAPTTTDAPTEVPETTAGGAAVAASGTEPAAATTRRRRAAKRPAGESSGEQERATGPEESADVPRAAAAEPVTTAAATLDVVAELGSRSGADATEAVAAGREDIAPGDDEAGSAKRAPARRSRARRATGPKAAHADRGGEIDVLAELGGTGRADAAEERGNTSRSDELDRLAATVAGEPASEGEEDAPHTDDAAPEEPQEPQEPGGTENDEDEDEDEDDEQYAAAEEPRLPAAALLFQAPEPRRRPRRATSETVRPSAHDDEGDEDAADEDAEQEGGADEESEQAATASRRRSDGGRGRATARREQQDTGDEAADQDDAEDRTDEDDAEDDDEQQPANRRRRRRGGRGRRRRGGEPSDSDDDSEDDSDDGDEDSDDGDDSSDDDTSDDDSDDSSDDEQRSGNRRRRRRRGGRGRSSSGGQDDATGSDDDSDDSGDDDTSDDDGDGEDGGSSRRRRRRRRSGRTTDDGGARARSEVTALKGSTRLEAKRQRRREGREAGRRRPIITESEFLARRESVNRKMVVREQDGLNQIAVLEDDMLVEHYVARRTQTSLVGNVYLGRVQNVLPSMEAAFIDIGKGRNAVLYAGEVNWDAAGMDGQPRRIEQAMRSGDPVLVQVTKDPIGHKGARLTSQITLAGRYLVLVPSGAMTGISRKLPENERARLKKLLKQIVPDDAGVIVRTAAEGASEEQLRDDVERLLRRWRDIEAKSKNGKAAPTLLKGEPELAVRVVRDVFNEDFESLTVAGDEAWATISSYVRELSPDLADRMHHWTATKDVFAEHRIDEQLAKGMDRKVWLPSGGSLVIDRTEAMTVVDVNTGKFTGSGGTLEETVTKNNLEAAEEIVRQLRLRDIGGIIVIDFIDMVLESNRDLVLRRLVECLGRDRTRHQVAEVTSLGLVQMTRKRVGQGLVEAFSTPCAHCDGRGFVVHDHPVETGQDDEQADHSRRRGGRRGGSGNTTDSSGSHGGSGQGAQRGSSGGQGRGKQEATHADESTQAARDAVKATLATIAAAAASAHQGDNGASAAGQKALELAADQDVLPAGLAEPGADADRSESGAGVTGRTEQEGGTGQPEPSQQAEPEKKPATRTRRGTRRATAPSANPEAKDDTQQDTGEESGPDAKPEADAEPGDGARPAAQPEVEARPEGEAPAAEAATGGV